MEEQSKRIREDSRGQVLPEVDQILTVPEVAEMLRVPVSWVYEHVRSDGEDRLPHFKLGKYVRFHASALRAWLQDRRGERD